jgi:plasmid stabilization system protein ParE
MQKRNKVKPILISPQAKEDINDVLLYLTENYNQKTVDSFLKKLESFYFIISLNPRIFGYYNTRKNIRKYALTKYYIIYYRNKKSRLEIIAVFDERRNPAELKKKLKQ